MIEIAELVTLAAEIAIPFLKSGGKKFAEKAGEASWDQMQKVWHLLSPKIESDPDLRDTAKPLADRDSQPLRAGFEAALRAHLEQDQELRNQLAAILGGMRNLQSIEATSGGLIEDVEQKSSGSGNQQIVKSDGGRIRNTRQIT
jgi:hypothetical protein